MAMRDDNSKPLVEDGQLERRRFLRNAAIAAWSSPVIVSVLAGRAAANHGGPGNSCARPCSATTANVCTNTCLNCCVTGQSGEGTVAARNNTCGKPLNAPCAHAEECCSNNCALAVCAPAL